MDLLQALVNYISASYVISSVIVALSVGVTFWLLGQRRGVRPIKRNMHMAYIETVEKRKQLGDLVTEEEVSNSARHVNKKPSKQSDLRAGDENGLGGSGNTSSSDDESENVDPKKAVKIFFGTQTGIARRFAIRIQTFCRGAKVHAILQDLASYDPEESLHKEDHLCIFVISTYVEGAPPESAKWFHRWLGEAAVDFRVGASHLQRQRYAVVGLGNSVYKENFNKVAKEVDQWLKMLSATAVLPIGILDENTAASKHGGLEEDFENWCAIFKSRILATLSKTSERCCSESNSEDCSCRNEKEHLAEPDTLPLSLEQNGHEDGELYDLDVEDDDGGDISFENNEENGTDEGLMDLEDLGNYMVAAKKDKQNSTEPREMITPLLRKSLEKQGYRLLGTHSGVKMCRWTKSMLRGRGGCYKHSFYGIASHQCMEATPSLACANKCVFCWRHHTNPVGTEWRWKTDPPQQIFEEALNSHRGLVRQFRGVPGVKEDRFQEGLNVRHCALSLVGEPIMYPHINQLVQLLHGKEISTFLVTNAQFPDAIRQLNPVTQLYVSVDASTKDSLKRIDRPLFRDFWERMLDSLKALSEKGQRTVYRLTLVKQWNTDELAGYVRLVKIGRPDFIEVKGVTFCGDSKASSLTMKNVPWHEEVLEFCQQLNAGLEEGSYEIACEHEHSNCVLIANTKFKVEGKWHTWIDYEKFHNLFRRWLESDGSQKFDSTEYMATTPTWAVIGASERGFDPVETRFHKERRKPVASTQ